MGVSGLEGGLVLVMVREGPQELASPWCWCRVSGNLMKHASVHAGSSGLAAYLGCESAWEPGKRLEWRTSHLTGYGMESSGHSRALEHAGSGPPERTEAEKTGINAVAVKAAVKYGEQEQWEGSCALMHCVCRNRPDPAFLLHPKVRFCGLEESTQLSSGRHFYPALLPFFPLP